jgi:hypothetical protein
VWEEDLRMPALTVIPGKAGSARLEDVPEPASALQRQPHDVKTIIELRPR